MRTYTHRRYSKEQMTKIKALFSGSSSINGLVSEEIKKTLDEKTAKLKETNKVMITKEAELEKLKGELETAMNTFNAKKEMFYMKPALATEDEVVVAMKAVEDLNVKIENKTTEIKDTMASITELKTTINALKSQL